MTDDSITRRGVLTGAAAAEPQDYTASVRNSVQGLRIGVQRAPFFEGIDPETATAVERAIVALRRITSTMSRNDVPNVTLPSVDTYPVVAAEIAAYHVPLVADPVKRALYSPVTLERILRDSTVTAPVYIESRRQMLLARRQAASAFADIDILVTPTTMFPPVRIDAALAAAPDEFSMIRNTLPFNALGLPTISVPCGLTRARLPIGLQLTAPWLGEARLLALAHAYELTIQFDRFEPPLA